MRYAKVCSILAISLNYTGRGRPLRNVTASQQLCRIVSVTAQPAAIPAERLRILQRYDNFAGRLCDDSIVSVSREAAAAYFGCGYIYETDRARALRMERDRDPVFVPACGYR